jgi:AraC-like DNA-binding protein
MKPPVSRAEPRSHPVGHPVTEAVTLLLERGAEIDPGRRVECDPALIFPLDQSVVEIEIAGATSERVERSSFACIPPNAAYRVRSQSAMTAIVTVVLRAAARERAANEYRGNMSTEEFDTLVATSRVLPRTRWVDEVVQRYLFERDVCERHASHAAIFLETEITKELFFLCKERQENRTRATVVHEEGDTVQRARAWIEANLFSPLRVGDLAKHCATSESTLLRAFQRELGRTPTSYARERRLDAALLLLKSSRYGVGEVATRVGYSNLPAFTEAFHKHFGVPPSQVKGNAGDAEHARERLPPHGKPPRRKRRKV